MSLNDTLERLAKEREEREHKAEEAAQQKERTEKVREFAERIFFDRMLKDINHGMSEPKIESMIDRSIRIAKILTNKLYL